MALSGYEKQKRWREKNRALYNLQQRNRRAKKGGDVKCDSVIATRTPAAMPMGTASIAESSEAAPKVQSSGAAKIETRKVGELRMIVIPKEVNEVEVVKPLIYRDDYGRVITERQWDLLQRKKQAAREHGYVIDDYSQ